MCPPTFFNIEYAINPWMKGNSGCVDQNLAFVQWQNLVDVLTDAGAEVRLISPSAGLPDQVFTANIAALLGNQAVISNFAFRERAAETITARQVLQEMGFDLHSIPDDLKLEGTGDFLRDFERPLFWAGYGHRTSLQSHLLCAQQLQYEVVSLHLVNPRFYHLDVCLAPLPGGFVMYYPEAFDADGLAEINARVPQEKQIQISQTDALNLACNAIPVGQKVILYKATDDLKEALIEKGFQPVEVELDQFLLSGGSARCMVLPLVEPKLAGSDSKHHVCQKDVLIQGHLLDFCFLSKCLDYITTHGCEFDVVQFKPGHKRQDASKAIVRIFAPNLQRLEHVSAFVEKLIDHKIPAEESSLR